MSVLSAHEAVRTRTCAWQGCERELTGPGTRRGLGAYCGEHKITRQTQLQAGRKGHGIYEERVRVLAQYARQVDRARGKEAEAAFATEEAIHRYRRALRALAEAEGL